MRHDPAPEPGEAHGEADREPIAVVGISALYPGAHTVDDYWRLLTDTEPPSPQGARSAAGRLEDIEIDVARYGIPPAQARSMARMQLLMLEAARRCLDDAGHPERSLPADRTDVVVGTCFGLDRQYANALRIAGARYARDLEAVATGPEFAAAAAGPVSVAEEFRGRLRRRLGASPHDRVGEMASTIPARIAAACRLRGRTLAVESADATSYVGVAHALDTLRGGLSDAVLVVAGQREEGRFPGQALAGKGLLAEETRPLAPDGDGFALGAGVGGLLLKRLSTALRDGDRVYATILDCTLGHQARRGVFRYPTVAEHRRRQVATGYRRAAVTPSTVGYVECAGYGVVAEARSELDALAAVFSDGDRPAGAGPAVLGSVRDRLGHTFANSGLAGISKVALALYHRTLPPLRRWEDGAPPDLAGRPFRVARAPEPWPQGPDGTPRRAAVSGASLTGTVCHLLLQEHTAPPAASPRPAGALRTDPASRASVGSSTAYEPIAVVGYGGRFGDAADADGLWTAMKSGRDLFRPLPEALFDRDLYHSPGRMSPDHSYTDLGAPVTVPDTPPDSVRIPPRRWAAMDAAQRLALTVADEMFTRGGQGPDTLRGSGLIAVGSNLGLTGERLAEAALCRDELEAAVRETAGLDHLDPDGMEALLKLVRERHGEPEETVSPSALDGVLAGGVPAVIANEYGLSAVPVAVEAACASSLAALDMAVSRLRSGTADFAVAGGVELPCNPRDMSLCSALGLLTHERITPFDAGADGFTPGDGCALFLLKRLSDARRDGDRVHGLIRGVGGSNDARSLIAPDVSGQARAMRQAFDQVDFEPVAVDYLEAHGTGTRVGDRVEIDAVAEVYAGPRRGGPLRIGSVKSFVGHTFAAAGGAGLLRVLLALRAGAVPPNVNLHGISPELDLARIPARVPTEAARWERQEGRPRRAAVSSFGTGGINYHLLVEEHMDGPG